MATVISSAREVPAVLTQPHLREIEDQLRLPVAAKHQPRDQHRYDQTEQMPKETAR